MEGCHCDELGGGHFGRDKTFAKVTERFYWVGIINDVKEFCRTCDKCQKANRYVKDNNVFVVMYMYIHIHINIRYMYMNMLYMNTNVHVCIL